MHTRFPSLEALSKKACINLLSLACQQDGDHIHTLQTMLNQSSKHASTYLKSLLLETTLHHGKKLLIQACDNGLAVTVDTLLNALSDKGDGCSIPRRSPWQHRAHVGRATWPSEIVQLLLDTLQVVNADLPSAINHAASRCNRAHVGCANGHTEIVQLLKTLQDADANLPAAIVHATTQSLTPRIISLLFR